MAYALDPSGAASAAVMEAGTPRKLFRRLTKDGHVEAESTMAADSGQCAVPWYKLQRTLAALLPEDTVRLGREFDSYTCEDDRVVLKFRGGETVEARIVIGADGNMSRLRAALFEDEEPPKYAGSAIWRMFLSGEFPGLAEGILSVWTGDGQVFTLQQFGAGDEARVYVSAQSAWPDDDLGTLDRRRYVGAEDGGDSGGRSTNAERFARFAQQFEGFPQDVISFAKEHVETASILEQPIYYREVGRPSTRRRTGVDADAAGLLLARKVRLGGRGARRGPCRDTVVRGLGRRRGRPQRVEAERRRNPLLLRDEILRGIARCLERRRGHGLQLCVRGLPHVLVG